jgi:hypothetical protein
VICIRITKKYFEAGVLVLFTILYLWNGLALLYDNQIQHRYPHGYLQRDTFEHLVIAENLKETGNSRYAAPFMADGHTDVIENYPPFLHHISVIFSIVSGLEVYDVIPFMLFIMGLFAALAMYLIIKCFNENVALLSLPLALTFFTKFHMFWFFVSGDGPSFIALSFVVFFLLVFEKIELRNFYIIAGLLLSAIIFSHISDAYIIFIFFILYFGLRIVKEKKIDFQEIKQLGLVGIVALVVSFDMLLIIKFVIMSSSVGSAGGMFSNFSLLQPGNYAIRMEDFGILLWVLVIGLIFSMVLLFKRLDYALLVGLSSLISGYSNLIGNSGRAVEVRALLPIGLMVFLGVGIYQILKFFVKKWRFIYSVILTSIVLFYVPTTADHNFGKHSTLMDQYHWDSLMWLKQNTDKDAKVYYFYSDNYFNYYNAIFHASMRYGVNVELEDFVDGLRKGIVKRTYKSINMGFPLSYLLPYRKGLFSFGFYWDTNKRNINVSICDMDYYSFDKLSRQQALAQGNMFVRDKLLSNSWMEEVYSNAVVSIVKNNKPGADCIE